MSPQWGGVARRRQLRYEAGYDRHLPGAPLVRWLHRAVLPNADSCADAAAVMDMDESQLRHLLSGTRDGLLLTTADRMITRWDGDETLYDVYPELRDA